MKRRAILVMCYCGLVFVVVPFSWARKWTDRSGKYTIEAELVEVDNDYVVLKKTDGSTIRVALARHRPHTNSVIAIACSPAGEQAFSASWDGTAKCWEVRNGNVLQPFDCGAALGGLGVAPDGRSIFTGNKGGILRHWDVKSGKELRRFPGTIGTPHVIVVSPDGRTMLSTGYSDRSIRVWDVATGRELRSFSINKDTGKCIAISPAGGHAVWSCAKERRLWFW